MLKKNILSIALIVLLTTITVGTLFYFDFWQKEKKVWEWPELQQTEPEEKPEEKVKEKAEKNPQEQALENKTLVVENKFVVNLPQGWQEVGSPPNLPAAAMAMNLEEEITNEKAKEIGFQTFLTVDYTDLKEYDILAYIKEVQTFLTQSIPLIDFYDVEPVSVSGYDIHFLEAKSVQQDTDFSTLLAFIENEDNMVWAISFNTLGELWPDYKETFYQIAESFRFY